ncbi:MAG: class I tRNA ligase family protein, partial [Candidatus Lokiarchaeota archaeon]|nr:class I tRNA ligase family protein [Candidatus Lokiarchaeota archaeon]
RKRGLGTQLPFDKNWIIESLSDSTIYMSFYTIIHLIKKNDIKPEQLTLAFFDYILLNIGDIRSLSNQIKIGVTVLEQMQQEFSYWYPVDHRHTAIMHISNHLSFYIFHHVAIFPEEHWPKIVSLIEPVIIEGQKMGKSKGNVISIANIKSNYSADLFRFYICHSADFGISVDWREKQLQIVKNHIMRFYNFVSENIGKLSKIEGKVANLNTKYAKIILSKCTKKLVEAEIGLEDLNIRKYLQLSFYEVFNVIQDFNRFCEDEKDILEVYKIIFPNWVKLLSLTMPHLCEELWETMGNTEFLSNVIWDDFNKDCINNDIETEFDYISDVIADILNIQRIVSSTNLSKIYLYTAPSWKYEILKIIYSKKGDFKKTIEECKQIPDVMKNSNLIPFVKNQIENRIWEKDFTSLREKELLKEYKGYIEKRINSSIIINSDYDPKKRSPKALPNKPAIYLDI